VALGKSGNALGTTEAVEFEGVSILDECSCLDRLTNAQETVIYELRLQRSGSGPIVFFIGFLSMINSGIVIGLALVLRPMRRQTHSEYSKLAMVMAI
jgi:hypothetical protein